LLFWVYVTDKEIVARFDALEKEIATLKKRQPDADPFLRRTEAKNPLGSQTL
jgi:hypothetical protein